MKKNKMKDIVKSMEASNHWLLRTMIPYVTETLT